MQVLYLKLKTSFTEWGDYYSNTNYSDKSFEDKKKILDNKNMNEGDVVIALPSSGVHSNGFSLVRKVFDIESADLGAYTDKLEGKTLGETLLTPTKIYVKSMLALMTHAIDGNHTDELKQARDDLQKYLIRR